jgi:hypothetical protein
VNWTIIVDTQLREEPTDDQLDDLLELLREHGGAIAGGVGFNRLTGTFSLEGPDTAGNAGRIGETVFNDLAAKAGLTIQATSGLEVMTWATHDVWLATPAFPPLVGVAEVAEMLGVSKSRVSTLSRRDDIPAPVAHLAAGPVWRAGDLSTFVQRRARQSGRPSEPT